MLAEWGTTGVTPLFDDGRAILDQMRVLLAIPGSDSDGKLREAAERMWNDFTKNAKNPLAAFALAST